MRSLLLACTLLLAPAALPPAAWAAGPAQAPTVTQAWSRATPGTAAPGAAYLTLQGGDAPDRLVSVSSPRGQVQIHSMAMQGDVMRMREVDGIDIPAHATVTLAPGGYHLMVMGLKAPLKQGETLPLTLHFLHAPDQTVQAQVEAIGATAPHKP